MDVKGFLPIHTRDDKGSRGAALRLYLCQEREIERIVARHIFQLTVSEHTKAGCSTKQRVRKFGAFISAIRSWK